MDKPDVFMDNPVDEAATLSPFYYPFSEPIELYIIGAMIADGNNCSRIMADCIPAMFYSESEGFVPPRVAFRAAQAMFARNMPVTRESLHEEHYRTLGEDAGDSDRLLRSAMLTYRNGYDQESSLSAAMKQLAEYYEMRNMVKFAETLANRAGWEMKPPSELIPWCRQYVASFGRSLVDATEIVHVADFVAESAASAQACVDSGKELTPWYPTGFTALDLQTGGLRDQEAWTWMAPTNTGKSRVTIYSAVRAAAHVPVAYISLEMADYKFREYLESTIGSCTGQPVTPYQLYRAAPDEMWRARWRDVTTGADSIEMMIIQQADGASLTRIGGWMRMLAQMGVKVAYIDQVQSITEYAEAEGREQWALCGEPIRYVSRLAKELGICVVLIHQSKREDYGKPSRGAAAGSRLYEHISDHVIQLHDIEYALIEEHGGYVIDDGIIRQPRTNAEKETMERKVGHPRPIRMAVTKTRGPECGASVMWFDYRWGCQVEKIDGQWVAV